MNAGQAARMRNIHIDQTAKQEQRAMAFVNEYISKEDFEKYRLHERDDAYGIGATRSDNWTIDRERDMIFRCVGRDREERAGQTVYAFYWKGCWTTARIGVADCGGSRNGPQWVRYMLHNLSIPPEIEKLKDSYLMALKEALTAYQDFGVRSNATEFTATFDF